MRTLLAGATVVAVVLVGSGLGDDAPAPSGASARVEAEERVLLPAPTGAPDDAPATSPLVRPAAHGDGDSWRDTAGTEYRLGLVNAPEQDECFGSEATAERRRQVAAGFRAEVYTVDRYGRGVSVVTTADGRNLNVHLARHGFVDDRYLAQFRHEHPSLAAELDVAFAEARAQGRGLWSACAAKPEAAAPAPVAAPAVAAGQGCHPDYLSCIPVEGDGSGHGRVNDLDCGDVQGSVEARQPGVDPYRLDADGDGVGCDS
jgi:endonuclease YncB( thermonuclease family)